MTASTRNLSIALLSSSSLPGFGGLFRRAIEPWGWEVAVWEAGFNQYRQEIANPASDLYRTRPDVVLLHLDGEDLFADCLRHPFEAGREARGERARLAACEIGNWAAMVRAGLPGALVVLNTIYLPPSHALTGLEFHSPWGLADLAMQFNCELGAIASAQPNVLVDDVASLVQEMGYRQWFDPRLWHLARCRLSNTAMKRLARNLAALVRAWKGQTRKCIVLDLDNTLWGGIIGEDGMEGIALAEEGPGLAFTEFQEELAHLLRKGVLLAICSKNNEGDALEVLRRHPSMRLREDSFAAHRINWQDKAQNIRELAAELNLGLDSFVFIDDNPAERTLIRQSIPGVHVPEWPQEPSQYRAALLDLAAEHFGRVSITSEDRERTALYRAERERAGMAASAGSLTGYYRSLEMQARIGRADSFSIPRIAQLTQKTNQFNLTTRRYTEADIRAFSRQPDAVVLWLQLRDRFSDQGIVGVLILKRENGDAWRTDTFLLSCRVIGRGVENAFLGYAGQILLDRGAGYLTGEYLPTQKNRPAANVYRDCGFERTGEDAGATLWSLNLKTQPIPIPDWIAIEPVKEETAHVG
jgi:FkbH-like protein